jgi:protein TonB
MRYRPLTKFVLLSALIHLLSMQLSGYIVAMPERAAPPEPVRVKLIEEPQKTVDDKRGGRVEDLPVPVKEEKPEYADILSRGDAVAHAPQKGDRYQRAKTAIPRQRVAPAAPTTVKAPQETPRRADRPQKTDVASLPRPDLDLTRKNTAEKIDLFSTQAMERALTTEKTNRADEGKPVERTAAEPTVTLTDQVDPKKKAPEPVTGVDASGAELDPEPMSDTRDVIDMGDEAIVSLNTRHFAYVDYFAHIKKAVELVWSYPEQAVIRGWSGHAKIKFTLEADGRLSGVELITSSGHKVLDDEATLAIKVGGPYKPFPPGMGKKRLHIVGDFVYLPSYGAVR